MALVLCTGIDKALLETRRYILERAGHTVVTVSDELTLLTVCKKHSFEVAVIGQTTGTGMKRRFRDLIREHCTDAKILELYQPHVGRVLEDADSHLEAPVAVPKELADRVNELANGKKDKEAP
jgi:hypothetical protein